MNLNYFDYFDPTNNIYSRAEIVYIVYVHCISLIINNHEVQDYILFFYKITTFDYFGWCLEIFCINYIVKKQGISNEISPKTLLYN